MNRTLLLILVLPVFLCRNVNAQQFGCEVIKETTHLQIRDKKLTRTETVVLQVNDRTGDEAGNIPIFYSKGDKVTLLEARLEDKNGKVIRTLKKNEVTDRSYISDFSLYEDDFVKSFQLKHNQYPYRIVYSYRITTPRFLVVEHINYWNYKYPVHEQEVIVDTPASQPIKYVQRNIPEPVVTELDKSVLYNWSFHYSPGKKKEIMVSPNLSDAPYLYILTEQFDYGKKGSWDSWEAFAVWVGELNKNRRNLPPKEKERVDKLLEGIENDREKARILYEYVWSNTRYINVSIKLGGLQTYPASYVSENKYGDCKALSNYYCALLDYAQIPCFYTLVNVGRSIRDVDVSFPAQVFNHVIVTVPFGPDTLFIDCTTKNLPFGYIPSSLQGRDVLLTGENGGKLMKIPAHQPEDIVSERNLTIEVASGTISKVKINSRLKGDDFEEGLYMMTQVNKNLVDNYLKNTILTGSYTLENYDFEKSPADASEIFFKALVNYHHVVKTYDTNLLLQPFSFSLPNFEDPADRTQPVQIDYPVAQQDTILYVFSHPFEGKIPGGVEWDTPYGKYSVQYALKENKLIVCKSIRIPAGRYSLEEYPEFYQFISNVRKQENKTLLIEKL